MTRFGELIPHDEDYAQYGLCLCDSCCKADDNDSEESADGAETGRA